MTCDQEMKYFYVYYLIEASAVKSEENAEILLSKMQMKTV